MKKNAKNLEALNDFSNRINSSIEKLSAVEKKQQAIDIAVLDVLHDKPATLQQIVAETKFDKFVVLKSISRINSKQTWIDFERIEGNFKKFFLVKITRPDHEC